MKKLFVLIIVFLGIITTIYSQKLQPEYTSYESPNTTDMVNLVTGDFVYNMPLLHVPGPAKGFDLPLSYHGGILPNQDASWVGLGWSLNCGAINRNISKFPDDFNGETIESDISNKGITAVTRSWVVFSDVKHSEKGYGYSLTLQGLNYSWGKANDNAISIIGIGYNFEGDDKGMTFDSEEFVTNVAAAASYLVGAGVITGPLSSVIGLLDVGIGTYTQLKGMDQLGSVVSDFSDINGLWKTEVKNQWVNTDCLLKSTQRQFINTGNDEISYGTLYLQNITRETNSGMIADNVYDENGNQLVNYPHVGNNYVHDYNMHVDNDVSFQWSLNPTDIAYDYYSVQGTGVSGTITPYRLDAGSISTNNFGDYMNFLKLCTTPFKNHRVNFRYKGDIANKYTYLTGENYGIDMTAGDLVNQVGISVAANNNKPVYTVSDDILYDSNKQIETDREGLYSKRLASGRYIKWVTNDEILNGTAFTNKNFLDFLSPSERASFRDECKNINYLDDFTGGHGIGGISITREDGVIYHYALPVYNLATVIVTDINYEDISGNTVSTHKNLNKFAIHWLLTAITGPDYIDRNDNNIVDEGDWGYWVNFSYTKGENAYLRTPFDGYIYSPDEMTKSVNASVRETYYLKSIGTPTHTAFFQKSVREDGKSRSPVLQDVYNSHKLNNIYLLNRKDYTRLIDNHSTNIDAFEMGESDSNIQSFLKINQIKKISFNYNYELCNGYPTNFNGNGKLSLQCISTRGINDTKLLPDFVFEYGANPNYNLDYWDGWGMYKIGGSNTNRIPTGSGTQWALTKITTPIGSVIEIEQERDKYSNVSGYSLPQDLKGGNARVSEIIVNDGIGTKMSKKYIYTKDGTANGQSSGACSIEPSYNRSDIDLYDVYKKQSLLNYPNTPVLYGKVTVLSNNDESGNYLSKSQFEYEMPHYDMVTCIPNNIHDGFVEGILVKIRNYLIKVNTNSIGSLKTIKKYYNNDLVQSVKYNYTNAISDDQGIFTEGSIYFERCLWGASYSTDRLFRTTKIMYPNILSSVEYKSNGRKTTVSNLNFDFLTGRVLSKKYKNDPLPWENISGKTFIVDYLPAYKVYSNMGIKAENSSYKNMISQNVANLTKILDGSNYKVINANITKWEKDWTYRNYYESFEEYIEDGTISDIYRVNKKFIWKGDLNPDGTYSSSQFSKYNTMEEIEDNFNVIDSDVDGWQLVTEIKEYNKNSIPLEIRDINGDYSSTKMDVNNKKAIATISNASYRQYSYTGFEEAVSREDKIDFSGEIFGKEIKNSLYLSSEVSDYMEYMNYPQSSINAHTGNFLVRIQGTEESSGNTGGPEVIILNESTVSRKFQASVWVHENTSHAKLVIVSSETEHFNPDNCLKFGQWYLFTITGEIPAGESRKVYVDCIGSANFAWVDDFRVHPIDASMQSYVYDQHTGAVTAILDNNNIATKYTYDAGGKLIAVYKETPDGFKKISSHDYGYARAIENCTFTSGLSVSFNNTTNIATLTINVKNKDKRVPANCRVNFRVLDAQASLTKMIPPLTTVTFKQELRVWDSYEGSHTFIATLENEGETRSKGCNIPEGKPEFEVLIDGVKVNDGVSLDLGETEIGTTVSKVITINNPGTGVLEMRPFVVSSETGYFSAGGPFLLDVSAGTSVPLNVSYNPAEVGNHEGQLQLIYLNGITRCDFWINLDGSGTGSSGGSGGTGPPGGGVIIN